MLRKLKDDNRGVATIVATIVGIVVLMLSLSLLLAAYSLFSSTSRRIKQDECKELAKSISLELDKEITMEFDSYEKQKKALEDGKNSVWFYLRYNVWNNDNWPYYCETEAGHGKENAFRYFILDIDQLNGLDFKDMSADVSVCIFWESDKDIYQNDMKEGLPITIKITVSAGEQYYEITSSYMLSVGIYDDVSNENIVDVTSSVNPQNNSINVAEKWKWVLEARE